jgi:PAS domain S-box-containing protein
MSLAETAQPPPPPPGSPLPDSVFRAIADQTSDMVFCKDTEGRYSYVNNALAKLLGKPVAAIVGQRPADILDPETAMIVADADRRTLAGEEVRSVREIGLAGAARLIQVVQTPIRDAAGTVIGISGICHDETELLASIRRAEENERLLRSITDSARDAIFVKDRDLRYTFVNPAMAAIMGLPAERLIGHTPKEIFTPEDAVTVAEVDRKALSGEVAEAIRELAIGDQRRTFHSIQTPIRGDRGEVVGICGVVRDVTVQRRIDRMLNFTQFTIDHISTAVLWLTPEGRVVHANRAACTLLGHTLEELLRLTVEEFSGNFTAAIWQGDWDELRRQGSLLREVELIAKDGQRIPAEAAVSHLVYEGRHHACCLVTDLRGRRAAEAEFRRLGTAVEQAAESIMITDTAGVVEYVNPAFTRLTGYARDEVIGHNARLLNSGRQGPEVYRELWRTITAGETWRGRLVNRKKDGSPYEEEAVISPVRNPQEQIISYVAVKRDITQEVALEQQLRQAQKMEAVGNLAGGVAHDFNNLLMVIGNCAKFALDALPAGSGAAADLEQVIEAGRRASTLTRQLLAFSRRQTLSRQTEDLGQIVRELEKMLRRLIREDIVLDIVLPPTPCPVKVDIGQIEQVLVNMAVNASDAMPGGGRLTIEVEADVPVSPGHRRILTEPPTCPGSRFARLRIADSGTGMTPEVAAHIFEPFFTTKGARGTGLGLATAYGIVRQHEGAVGVLSQPGRGSEFVVYLPLDAGETELSADFAERLKLARGRESILLVEDNPLVRKITRRILESLGYQVTDAENGRRALAILETEPCFDLLVTDVVMPEMDGISLAVKAQELFPRTGVIYISGYPLAALSEHGLSCSPENLLQKPFSPQELANRVRAILDRRLPGMSPPASPPRNIPPEERKES